MSGIEGPLLVLGGGSNVVVADDGFDGTVVEVATSGVRADVEGDDPTCGGAMVTVAAGESWDDLVAQAVERELGRRRGARRHPRPGRRHPDPERRRLRPGGRQTIARVRVWDRVLKGVRTFANADCGFGYRTSRFKADPEPARRPRRHLPAPPGQPRRTGAVRRAGPRPRRRARPARPARRRARGRARAAPQQGHGPRPRRPRHLERRLVLHQPGRRRGRPARGRPGLAAARRPGQDERGVADRAGRLPQGVRRRAGRPLDQAHPGAHQPRWRHHRAAARAGPRGPRRRRGQRTASGWSTSRCWSAARSDCYRLPCRDARIAEPIRTRSTVPTMPDHAGLPTSPPTGPRVGSP